jgi:tRNA dimethylallyltransferase
MILRIKACISCACSAVGYKELFDYFDGKYDLNTAIEKIKQHSRNYARKQLSWFKRDQEIHWIHLSDEKIDVEAQIMKQLSHL